MLRYLPVALVMLVYLVIGALFAVYTPDWQAPDEPAHYNYIAQMAEDRRVPVIEPGDWDQDYLDALRSARFAPELLDDLRRVEYEDHQPPLYYALAVPVYLATDGDLTALRLYSMTWGLLIIAGAYALARLMFPARPWLALATASFVAFQPQQMHILASVNNDALAWGIVAMGLAGAVAYVKAEPGRQPSPWLLGLLVGVGLITKATTYFLAGLIPLAILLRWWAHSQSQNRDLRPLMRALAAFLIPALILGGVWWLRNIAVYGFPDFLGLAAHDAVVVGQPRTADLIERLGFGGYLREIVTVTFNSFWGQFGWMAVPLPRWTYTLIGVWLAISAAGWLVDAWQRRREPAAPRRPEQVHAWILLTVAVSLAVLAYLYYNTEFQQHQGRYMFTLLVPLGLALALGFDAWRRLIFAAAPPRLRDLSPALTVLAFWPLALLNVWLLWRVLIPNLAP